MKIKVFKVYIPEKPKFIGLGFYDIYVDEKCRVYLNPAENSECFFTLHNNDDGSHITIGDESGYICGESIRRSLYNFVDTYPAVHTE